MSEIFDENLTVIRARDPAVADHLSDMKAVEAKALDWEATDRWAVDVPTGSHEVYVVTGIGAHTVALRRLLEDHDVLIVYEPDVQTLRDACETIDFTALFKSRTTVLFVDLPDAPVSKATIHGHLAGVGTLLALGTHVAEYAPAMAGHLDDYRGFFEALADFTAFVRMSLTTQIINGEVTARNIAENLGYYAVTRRVNDLVGRFTRYPAIIVSAGPSLDDAIEELKRAPGHAVIIAVQTVLRRLLSAGITPDFVTSLDYHEISGRYFENLDEFPTYRTCLIAESKVNPTVLDRFHDWAPGNIFLSGEPTACLLGGAPLGPWVTLAGGSTVAHLAFYAAATMGCNPIVFVGQDLCYRGDRYYPEGVGLRLSKRAAPCNRTVPANDGSTVRTDEQLFSYLEQFGRDIAPFADSRTIINTSEHGARIAGTTVSPLRGVLDGLQRTWVPDDLFVFEHPPDGPTFDGLLRELSDRIKELTAFSTYCDEMLALLRELQPLATHETIDEFNERLNAVVELRSKFNEHARAFTFVGMVARGADILRYSADRGLLTGRKATPERSARQLLRDIAFVSAIHAGIPRAMDILESSVNRIVSMKEPVNAEEERPSTPE